MKSYILKDSILQKGYADNDEKALFLIKMGLIKVNGSTIKDSNFTLTGADVISIAGEKKFVSRGGDKLDHLLSVFRIDIAGSVCIDVGSSTGGFTDCLLQKGVDRVYAVDVGYGQLAWKLRQNEKVTVLEKTNFRYIEDRISELADIITVDVSFISLNRIFPVACKLLKKDGYVLSLVKPQFEVKKEDVDKGGVIKSRAKQLGAVEMVFGYALNAGLKVLAVYDSPIKGQKGNREFLMVLQIST